ncbi:MAG TPA: hypothetical protein PK413_16325, partial [Thermoanaerobaculia bacterium]|nr:hypothetical protein [Thermoanaerobaculia bacterium]
MSPKAKSQPANFAAALLAEAVLPVALVAVWPKGGARASNLREAETRPFRPGVLWLESDLCAVLPVAGDAAVFDTALTLVSELLTPSAGGSRVAPEGSVLIFPGRVFKKGSEVRLDANPLVEAVRTSPPALPLGSIVMTSHAALRLETPRQSESAGYFEIPSGERVPLLRVRGLEVDTPAGRNPSFLRRRTPYLDRPAVAETLVSLPWRSVLSGPLGSGKSRAVWETLNERKIPSYWVTAHPDRQGGPSLAAQLVFRLLTSPRYEVRAHTLNGFAGLGEGVLELAQAPTLVLEP